jgi:putative FmdB family regulatory protein
MSPVGAKPLPITGNHSFWFSFSGNALCYHLKESVFLRREKGMPSYDYRCVNCKKEFSTILSMKEHDARKAKCPKCGGKKLEQRITSFMVKTSRKS